MNNDTRTVFCWPWPYGIMAGAVTALFPHPGLWHWGAVLAERGHPWVLPKPKKII